MKFGSGITVATIGALTFASAASAKEMRDSPELFRNLLDCRSIADSNQRLACFDKATGALDEAQKKRDLVVVDRKQIRETRKSLFGFTLPKIGIFGGDDDKDDKRADADEIQEIESVVEGARPIQGGNWSLRLAKDAGTWETTSTLTVDPRAGDKVKIKKASLGSYLGSVGINRGVRFRRVQ